MSTLLLVGLQNDFMPGGALPVPEGDQVIALVNTLMERFGLIVTTQVWHPADHGCFAASHPGRQVGETVDLDGLPQVLQPVHCVAESAGAEFPEALNTDLIARAIRMGTDPCIAAFSGFFDNGRRRSTGMETFLREQAVEELCICGVATDSYIKNTALDARRLGFPVTVIQDACRGRDREPGDVAKAIEEMQAKGVRIVESTRWLAPSRSGLRP